MARYPKATFRPLATVQTQPRMQRHDVICLHTMVGTLTGTDSMFHAHGWQGTESHFGVGGKWGDGRDGEVIQWQDTDFTADANLDGNHRVISIETGDNFPGRASDIQPWTPKQLDAIVELTAWLCRTHDVPAVQIHDSRPDRRGIGVHRLGIDPWRRPDGEHWSTKRGKECPSDARISQVPEIVDRVAKLLKTPTTTQESDDVSFTDRHTLTASDVAAYGDPKLKVGGTKSYDEIVRFPPAVSRLRREQAAGIAALTAAVSALAKAVTAGGSLTEQQITAAAEAGATAALAKLGDVLTE